MYVSGVNVNVCEGAIREKHILSLNVQIALPIRKHLEHIATQFIIW